MKKSKKNYLLVALVVILLALAVGYAAFSQQLQITGTATAIGEWNIHFANETMTPAQDENNTVSLSDNNHKMAVAVSLAKPGDSRTVTVDVVNEGSVDATLTNFVITAEDGSSQKLSAAEGGVYTSGAIKMTLQQLTTDTDLEAKTGKTTYTMKFEWPDSYNLENVNDTANFTITFDYSQK